MHRDFFISRAGADSNVAKLIDKIVREAGKTTWLQDTDFGHASFMAQMAEGFSGCGRMISLLSSNYQESDYCKKEYEVALTDDPRNLDQKLIVLRIDDCVPIEHLKDLAYTDLVPLLNNVQSIERIVRVAIGVDTDKSDVDFAKIYHRSPIKIIHPSIKKGHGLVERNDLLESIHDKLQGPDISKAALTDVTNRPGDLSVVHGVGGVGKSVLAKQYAWEYREYYAGVWWIRADTRQNMRDDILTLGTQLILNLRDIQDEDVAVNTVLEGIANQWAQTQGLPWLLVYDNAESPVEIEELTPREGAAVLVTSRRTDWQDFASEIAIDVFTKKVAVEFLLEGSREQDESAEELADALGCLPLALAHARAYCTSSGCSFDDFRSRLPALIKKAPTNAPYPQSVFATYNLALEQAAVSTPEAEVLINVLAFLAPECVPRSLLVEELGDRCDDGVSALANASLITLEHDDSGAVTVSCHRLVQEVARARLGDNKEELIGQCLEMLIKAWPGGNQGSDPQFWPICRSLLSHAQTLLSQAKQDQEYAARMALLMDFVAEYHGSQGKYEEAEPLYRKALEIRQRVQGEENPDTATSYNNLAINLGRQGKYEEADPMYRKGLEIKQSVLGEEHPITAISYNNLAHNLDYQGKHEEAEPLYRKGLEINLSVLGEEHPNTAISYNNVAYNLDRQGKYEEADPMYRKGLEINQRVLGEDHPNIATSYNNVASNLDYQGKHEEAEPLHRKDLEINQRVLGEEHPTTAISYNNVAHNLDYQGKHEEAEPLYRLAYEILLSALGDQHPTTKTIHQNWLSVKSKMDN